MKTININDYEKDIITYVPYSNDDTGANNKAISELTEDDNKYVGISVIGNIYDNPELIDE